MNQRVVVVLYGLVNAVTYSCLLPLWEGFDEGYHYGYVQLLSTTLRFPAFGQANLSREIFHAYELTPVSPYLQPFTKAPMNFDDYFALSASEREGLRRKLEAIPAGEKFRQQPDKPNYEVMQAPLPYLFMAIVDRVLADRPVIPRVLWLRLVCAVAAVLMLAHATLLLAREVSLAEPYATGALFCIFSSQMLYAVLCHICNDALAAPLLCYLVWASIRSWRTGSARAWLVTGLFSAAAALTKAYLLFVLPLPAVLLAVALWRRRATLAAGMAFCLPLVFAAGPWYVRNVLLYHNLSGAVEQTTNLGLDTCLNAVVSLPWLESVGYIGHSGLWTGNNSFTTFSSATLNLILVLLVAGAALYFMNVRWRAAELGLASAVALFAVGLAFIAVSYYVSSNGVVIAPAPWHSQALVAPVMLIVFLGFSRAQPWGRVGLSVYALVWMWMLIATWFVKLLPWYAGFRGRATAAALWHWYMASGARRDEILGHTCMASPPVLWALVSVSGALALLQAAGLLASAVKNGAARRTD